MANPNAGGAEVVKKTPAYAWPCLILSMLCAASIAMAWQWLPGVTFPVFQGWMANHNPTYDPSLMSNVMGLVPIGALIMAFPTSLIVRYKGPKFATVTGMAIVVVGMLIQVFTVETNWIAFLAGRFILGLGLSTAIVAGPTCVSIWFPHSTRGRGMAIWSCWAPLGIFTINAISTQVFGAVSGGSEDGSMVNFLWVWTIVCLVIGVLFAIVFREPRGDEKSEVSAERKSFKDVLPLFKQRQLWCLFIMFAIFNYMNYSFSQYLKTWLQVSPAAGGMGWDAGMAGLIGGAITACGILAPLGGFILDKTPRWLKYICVVAGITSLTICCAFSFNNSVPAFAAYVIFFCIGNMFLNGCCRPMVPTYVFKGGATAVALGLSFLTCAQYLGQIPTSYVLQPFIQSMSTPRMIDGVPTVMTDPMLAVWALVPVGVVGIILSFLMKPNKAEAKKMKEGGGKPAPAGH